MASLEPPVDHPSPISSDPKLDSSLANAGSLADIFLNGPFPFEVSVSNPASGGGARPVDEEEELMRQLQDQLAVEDKEGRRRVETSDLEQRLAALRTYKPETGDSKARPLPGRAGLGDAPIHDPYEWELAASDGDDSDV
jgi:hypothetical protein